MHYSAMNDLASHEMTTAGRRQPPTWPMALAEDDAFLLGRLGALAVKRFAVALAPLELRPLHYAVLSYLDVIEGSPQRAIVDGLAIGSSTIVGVLDDLERTGLAERRPSPTDRRTHAVFLSEDGRRVLAEARVIAQRIREELFAPLRPGERATLHGLLVRIIDRADESNAAQVSPAS
jgi:DNA-binding MarR family transcriptional regulator